MYGPQIFIFMAPSMKPIKDKFIAKEQENPCPKSFRDFDK